MLKTLTGDLRSSPGTAGEKFITFQMADGFKVSVYFELDNVVSPPDETLDAYTNLAQQALKREIDTGRQLQVRYMLQDGQLLPR